MTVAAWLLLAAGLSACGPAGSGSAGSGDASRAGGPPGARLIAFRGTFRLTGAIARQASFTSYPGALSATSSCADLAARGTGAPAGERPHFRIPGPAPGGNVYIVASISPYRGPGQYGRAAIVSGSGANIGVGTASYDPLAPRAAVSATINANGSGSFTFTGAAAATPDAAAPRPPRPGLSGTVRWTCSA
jgi:hypothetical protein